MIVINFKRGTNKKTTWTSNMHFTKRRSNFNNVKTCRYHFCAVITTSLQLFKKTIYNKYEVDFLYSAGPGPGPGHAPERVQRAFSCNRRIH